MTGTAALSAPFEGTEFSAAVPGGHATITVPGTEHLLTLVADRLTAGRGFALATVNLDHIVKLRADPSFRAAYAAHDLVVADGNPVVWLMALARRPVALVPGADLVGPLTALAAQHRAPIALVGATEETLARAAARLTAENPGLTIALRHAPARGFDPEGAEADAIIARLARSEARLVFLALGAPRQERFAARARARLPRVGFASIGAGLDFIAETQTRAPALLRGIALEWAWRLAKEPGRLTQRYAACAALMPRLAVAALHARLSESGGAGG
ncbi:MAG: WecB/TagA/CpsF family glycosyltransferase [Pseudomonadota bacterium]